MLILSNTTQTDTHDHHLLEWIEWRAATKLLQGELFLPMNRRFVSSILSLPVVNWKLHRGIMWS